MKKKSRLDTERTLDQMSDEELAELDREALRTRRQCQTMYHLQQTATGKVSIRAVPIVSRGPKMSVAHEDAVSKGRIRNEELHEDFGDVRVLALEMLREARVKAQREVERLDRSIEKLETLGNAAAPQVSWPRLPSEQANVEY